MLSRSKSTSAVHHRSRGRHHACEPSSVPPLFLPEGGDSHGQALTAASLAMWRARERTGVQASSSSSPPPPLPPLSDDTPRPRGRTPHAQTSTAGIGRSKSMLLDDCRRPPPLGFTRALDDDDNDAPDFGLACTGIEPGINGGNYGGGHHRLRRARSMFSTRRRAQPAPRPESINSSEAAVRLAREQFLRGFQQQEDELAQRTLPRTRPGNRAKPLRRSVRSQANESSVVTGSPNSMPDIAQLPAPPAASKTLRSFSRTVKNGLYRVFGRSRLRRAASIDHSEPARSKVSRFDASPSSGQYAETVHAIPYGEACSESSTNDTSNYDPSISTTSRSVHRSTSRATSWDKSTVSDAVGPRHPSSETRHPSPSASVHDGYSVFREPPAGPLVDVDRRQVYSALVHRMGQENQPPTSIRPVPSQASIRSTRTVYPKRTPSVAAFDSRPGPINRPWNPRDPHQPAFSAPGPHYRHSLPSPFSHPILSPPTNGYEPNSPSVYSQTTGGGTPVPFEPEPGTATILANERLPYHMSSSNNIHKTSADWRSWVNSQMDTINTSTPDPFLVTHRGTSAGRYGDSDGESGESDQTETDRRDRRPPLMELSNFSRPLPVSSDSDAVVSETVVRQPFIVARGHSPAPTAAATLLIDGSVATAVETPGRDNENTMMMRGEFGNTTTTSTALTDLPPPHPPRVEMELQPPSPLAPRLSVRHRHRNPRRNAAGRGLGQSFASSAAMRPAVANNDENLSPGVGPGPVAGSADFYNAANSKRMVSLFLSNRLGPEETGEAETAFL